MLRTSFSKRLLRAGVGGAFLLSLQAVATSCSHPQYALGDAEPDGGDDDGPLEPGKMEPDARVLMDAGMVGRDAVLDGDDAGPTAIDGPPAVDPEESLLGAYAMYARVYTRDTRTGLAAQAHRDILFFARIVRDASDALVMTVQRCREKIDTDQGLGLRFYASVAYPERMEATVHRVSLTGNVFRTESSLRTVGFGTEVPADCAPGKKVARPGIPWLADGTCDCPPADRPVPITARDCRVTDPDGDMLPGYTVKYTTNVPLGGDEPDRYCARQQYDLVQGTVAADRHHRALLAFTAEEIELEPKCANERCASPIKVCATKRNPVQLVPIEDAAGNCETLIQRADEGGLFHDVPRSFPDDC